MVNSELEFCSFSRFLSITCHWYKHIYSW